MNAPSSFRHVATLFLWTMFSLSCGGGEEAPTEEQLMAEKLRELVEAEGEAQGGAVTDQELKVWESHPPR